MQKKQIQKKEIQTVEDIIKQIDMNLENPKKKLVVEQKRLYKPKK